MSDDKEVATADAPEAQVQKVEVLVRRMLVIETNGEKVNLAGNTMFPLEAKASLEMVHTAICNQINQKAAQPAGVPPVKELLDESAVVEAEDEAAAAEAMASD